MQRELGPRKGLEARGAAPGTPEQTLAVAAWPWSLHAVPSAPRAGSACLGALPTHTACWPTLQGDSQVVIASVLGHRKVQRRDPGGPAGHAVTARSPQKRPEGLITLQVEAPLLAPQAH